MCLWLRSASESRGALGLSFILDLRLNPAVPRTLRDAAFVLPGTGADSGAVIGIAGHSNRRVQLRLAAFRQDIRANLLLSVDRRGCIGKLVSVVYPPMRCRPFLRQSGRHQVGRGFRAIRFEMQARYTVHQLGVYDGVKVLEFEPKAAAVEKR